MQQSLFGLCVILIVRAIFILCTIAFLGIGLGPDEAQYWTWSRDLAWGYYSKPPGIAWEIWLGCQWMGQSELGVRIMALATGTALSLAVYALARCCGLDKKTAFWSGVVMALTPLGVMASFLAITDGGMVLFWTLGCCLVAKALRDERAPSYELIGLCVLAGALFKWPMYILWVFIAAAMPFYRTLASWRFLLGVAISLLGMLPSVIWNYTHDWVTFRHVFATVKGQEGNDVGTSALPHGNFWEFIGAQAMLLSPLIFVLMVGAFVVLWRRRREATHPLFFCAAVAVCLIAGFSVMAVFNKMQGNWCDYAYPTAIVVLCWAMRERVVWVAWGLGLSVAMMTFGFLIPVIQANNVLTTVPIPYRVNPFRHNVGWEALGQELKEAGYDPRTDFLFGDKYQTSSILSFYGEGQKRAYFLNLNGIRNNQFSFWPGMPLQQGGKTGFFVVTENAPHLGDSFRQKAEAYQVMLNPYFRKVDFLGAKTLFYSYGIPVKQALIFRCEGYNGREPPSPNLY